MPGPLPGGQYDQQPSVEQKKKDKGHGGMMAGAAGGLAVGAVGGALVANAMGTYQYCYARLLKLSFSLSTVEHYPAVIINAKK